MFNFNKDLFNCVFMVLSFYVLFPPAVLHKNPQESCLCNLLSPSIALF
jgi:hypothetical protein